MLVPISLRLRLFLELVETLLELGTMDFSIFEEDGDEAAEIVDRLIDIALEYTL